MMQYVIGTHAEVQEFLLHYLEGDLPLLRRLRFRMHLLMCPICTRYLKQYRESVALARAYLDDPPPDELVELTLKFMDEHRPAAQGGPEPSRH